MKVTGVTFIRNAVKFDYPVVESIQSLLPLVDELIVVLGKSEDNTEALIKGIDNRKISILNSTWNDAVRKGGQVLALETNKGLAAVSQDTDWIFYLQADEVLHEADYDEIRRQMASHLHNPKVEGLLFHYLHFYGHYKYVGNSRRWYQKEVRIVRNLKGIQSYRDAQGFRLNDQKLRVKQIQASVFHYGWVKNPYHQMEKQKSFNLLWHSEEEVKKMVASANEYDYSNIDSLVEFKSSHPKVMMRRIEKANWEFVFDASKNKVKLKDRFLSGLETILKKPLFRYENYRLL
jgi:glycosyltransferase involved in cell wall biosynthesis